MSEEDQSRGRRRRRTSRSPEELDNVPSTSRAIARGRLATVEPKIKKMKAEYSLEEAKQQDVAASRDVAEPTVSDVQALTQSTMGKRDAHHNRTARDRYEIVNTRPSDMQSKKGTSGLAVKLRTNYFRVVTKPAWKIYKYHVTFEPEIDVKRVRSGILSTFKHIFQGYVYDGMQLFTTTKLDNKVTLLEGKSKTDVDYKITIKAVGEVSMSDWQSLQILNLILRRAMEGLNLQQVGRNLYDAYAKIDIREFNLQLWPGYETSIRQHEKDILLCAEITHKVMRTETVYNLIKHISKEYSDFQENLRRLIIGMIVLTDYNNKTYRINDIDFSQNPKSTFNMKNKSISFIDYYYQRYNIRIRDPNQPLLISKGKDVALRTDENELIVLIPELCRVTGLSDTMRNNFQLMRSLATYTKMNPDKRIDRLKHFNRNLLQTIESVKVLNDWNMVLDNDLLEVTGRVIDQQNIIFKENKKLQPDSKADWSRAFRDINFLTSPSQGLKNWAIIAPNRNVRDVRCFVDKLMISARGMGLNICRPREILVTDDRNHSYLQGLDESSRRDPQLILCLVPNTNVERYNLIKKKGCIERAIPTQVITLRTATNQRGIMSIATKVAIQINCKIGYTPWMIEVPISGLMTVGYDTAKSTRDKSKAFGALVASMDLQINSTFYSTVAECNSYDLYANSLWPMMTKALRQYYKEHNKLPARIIFYRDGVSPGSLKHVFEYEVRELVEKLDQEYKRVNTPKPPMFAYVVVTKSTNTRLFEGMRNPLPGTVVDDVITSPERYDFFLVSQFVNQGTVSPTNYNVLYSNIKLSPDQMQKLTYKMTHLYYNWSGTIRVPAVCQYAKKLAALVGINLHQIPHNALEKKFYYL